MDAEPLPAASPISTEPATGVRIVAIDAFRGLVMLLMMAEVLHLGLLTQVFPDAAWAKAVAYHTDHVEWVGCSLHDLIQPSFSFLVGVALVFSLRNRRSRGQPRWKSVLHALWRSLLLVALGIFLRSLGEEKTYFTFEDTLTQIGLGYFFLYLLALCPRAVQWSALGLILAGYWLAFLLYPSPPSGFDWQAVGVPPDWAHHQSGLAAHWDKNSNAAWAFDVWFLNLFPRTAPFHFNDGGYATLSFIPTLATMLLGLLAGGQLLNGQSPWKTFGWFVLVGAIAWGAGLGLHLANVCPLVKRIWTPSWTLFSGGWCLWILALFYLITEIGRLRAWTFPLVVIGMNSIAAYLIAHLCHHFFSEAWHTHAGHPFAKFGGATAEILDGVVVLLCYWLCLFWMWRRRLFLRI